VVRSSHRSWLTGSIVSVLTLISPQVQTASSNCAESREKSMNRESQVKELESPAELQPRPSVPRLFCPDALVSIPLKRKRKRNVEDEMAIFRKIRIHTLKKISKFDFPERSLVWSLVVKGGRCKWQ
jgi:hypothetical protein